LSCVRFGDFEELKSILKVFHEHEYPTIPKDPRSKIDEAKWSKSHLNNSKRYILKAVGDWEHPIDKEVMVNFYERMSEFEHQNNPPSVDIINNAIVMLKQVLPIISTSLDQLENNPWPVRKLNQFLQNYKEINRPKTNLTELLPIKSVTFSMIEKISTELLQLSKPPETSEDFSNIKNIMIPGDAWTQSLLLLNELIIEETVQNNDNLFNIAYAEIKKVYSQANPYQQCLCIVVLEAWHWFRTDKQRVQLLQELFVEYATTGIALSWAIDRLFIYFSSDQFDNIVRSLLRKKSIPFTNEFLNVLGKFVGGRAMLSNHRNEQFSAGMLIDEVISTPSEFLLLKNTENEVDF